VQGSATRRGHVASRRRRAREVRASAEAGGLSIRFPVLRPRALIERGAVKDDALSGLVLGVESVPDGLARGLLAGVNPVAGLYGHLFGMVGGALFTSTALMSIQATGAMAIVVADVDLAGRSDPGGSLVTLTVLTGVLMIVAGAARLGSALRFVSTSVTTGFVAAVGINIVLDQLGNLTGYAADGANRIARTVDLVLHPGRIDLPSLAVGLLTVALIVGLQRTRLGALGMVVAIVVGSAAAAAFNATVAVVGDVADVPSSLPGPSMPAWRGIVDLILPAVSLAFVGLVQGAGVSAGVPNPDGSPADASQDFVAQGAGNVVSGVFQGMPVGGSMSASALAVNAGARTRASMLFSGVVMALVIVTLAGAVRLVAMPALGGLLIVVGIATVKPAKIRAVARTGPVPLTVMTVTLVLTLLIPLQYAVLVGVGISVLLFVIGQSSRLVTRRVVFEASGRVVEVAPPDDLPPGEVVVLQPYGAIFFATASVLRNQMPTVTPESRGSVVILRLRGTHEAGVTLLDVLAGYARALDAVGSKLMVVTDNRRVIAQLHASGTIQAIGPGNVYVGTEVVGEALHRAHDAAVAWVARLGDDEEQA
jgi:SulP family sulfate permease